VDGKSSPGELFGDEVDGRGLADPAGAIDADEDALARHV
jgi:hypothetical protein